MWSTRSVRLAILAVGSALVLVACSGDSNATTGASIPASPSAAIPSIDFLSPDALAVE